MKTIPALLSIAVFLASCAGQQQEQAAVEKKLVSWTEDTKQKIIADANAPVDSVHTDVVSRSVTEITLYAHGKRTKRFGIATPSMDTIAAFFYSRDQRFAWVRELCPGVSRNFEGINYRGKPYGLATFTYCNGRLKKQGYRFRRNVGVWRQWDENGNLVDSVDYGNSQKLDSLAFIRFAD